MTIPFALQMKCTHGQMNLFFLYLTSCDTPTLFSFIVRKREKERLGVYFSIVYDLMKDTFFCAVSLSYVFDIGID